MFMLYFGKQEMAKYTFGFSIVLMLASLFLSLREIHLSIISLDIVLSDLESELTGKEHRYTIKKE
jgi:hypothetical protein